jgi:putative tricarboxylic transport membrane protein
MDVLGLLGQGFAIALLPTNLLACVIGVFLGTIVGILPGLGPPATMAMLLPLTYGMDPRATLIMFAGIYYGSKYGGAVTSILVNVPGESSSVMTTIDGYQMAKKGRAGPALGIAAIASFVAGTIGVVGLMLLAPPLAQFALSFGPPENFALVVVGLTLITFLAGESMVKALLMGCLGLAISLPGTDMMTGSLRFTFARPELLGGVDFVVVAIGLFAIGEILANLEEAGAGQVFPVPRKLSELLPSRQDLRDSAATILGSTGLGFLVGVVPGGNPAIATFLAYGATKALAKDPEVFGTGTIRGVAAPESADNAASCGAMVPLMTLGIPGNASTAMMLAALVMAGLQPGPLLMKQQPEFFWAVIASMYVGNVLLLVLNLPLVPLFASALRIPYAYLYPFILVICAIGTYGVNNNISDVWLAGVFGIVGYFLKKLEFPLAPVVLAAVLGPLMEKSLRQSLVLLDGNVLGFFRRPISALLLCAALLLLLVPILRSLRRWRSEGRQTRTALR